MLCSSNKDLSFGPAAGAAHRRPRGEIIKLLVIKRVPISSSNHFGHVYSIPRNAVAIIKIKIITPILHGKARGDLYEP